MENVLAWQPRGPQFESSVFFEFDFFYRKFNRLKRLVVENKKVKQKHGRNGSVKTDGTKLKKKVTRLKPRPSGQRDKIELKIA